MFAFLLTKFRFFPINLTNFQKHSRVATPETLRNIAVVLNISIKHLPECHELLAWNKRDIWSLRDSLKLNWQLNWSWRPVWLNDWVLVYERAQIPLRSLNIILVDNLIWSTLKKRKDIGGIQLLWKCEYFLFLSKNCSYTNLLKREV